MGERGGTWGDRKTEMRERAASMESYITPYEEEE